MQASEEVGTTLWAPGDVRVHARLNVLAGSPFQAARSAGQEQVRDPLRRFDHGRLAASDLDRDEAFVIAPACGTR